MKRCPGTLVSRYFVLLVLGSQLLVAATTGKIAGIVRDMTSGEPLIGANIVILEDGRSTGTGAATDAQGYYAILNIEPGIYGALVSYVGYSNVRITDIEVNINLTTELNVDMQVEVIGQEEVLVVATRELLKKDEFASTHNVTAEEMQVQPIDNFMSIAQNQPGVVGSHFRGGRSGEVLVVIDG
ncbi:MAG: carboxypeptidase-like regulatory domain-containing protein, partial [Candidatus Neomarinimicrobiota bacterium]